jgi:succinoglycan biosynthesis protein ExoO
MNEQPHAITSVSVIMPTYNSARTLDRAVASVLAQTHAAWELIIVDDASTDDTPQKIEHWRRDEDRILVIHGQHNAGPASARNRGLSKCRGEWVAILDADDAWSDKRLEALLIKAEQASADAVCDNLLGVDDELGRKAEPLYSYLPEWLDIVTAVAPTYAGTYNLGYLKPVVRRAFIERYDVRYDETLRTGEDLLFLLSLLFHGARVRCVDAPSYIYTIPVGGPSQRLSQSTNTLPRDADIAQSLARLRERYGAVLSQSERRAVDERIAYLRNIAPLSEFRHARLRGDWLQALKLALTTPDVRRTIFKAMMPRK